MWMRLPTDRPIGKGVRSHLRDRAGFTGRLLGDHCRSGHPGPGTEAGGRPVRGLTYRRTGWTPCERAIRSQDTEASPFIGRLDGSPIDVIPKLPLALSGQESGPFSHHPPPLLDPVASPTGGLHRTADPVGQGNPGPFPRATGTSSPNPGTCFKPVGNGRSLAHAIKVTRATRPNRRGMLPLPAHRQGQVGKLVPRTPGNTGGLPSIPGSACDASLPSRSPFGESCRDMPAPPHPPAPWSCPCLRVDKAFAVQRAGFLGDLRPALGPAHQGRCDNRCPPPKDETAISPGSRFHGSFGSLLRQGATGCGGKMAGTSAAPATLAARAGAALRSSDASASPAAAP